MTTQHRTDTVDSARIRTDWLPTGCLPCIYARISYNGVEVRSYAQLLTSAPYGVPTVMQSNLSWAALRIPPVARMWLDFEQRRTVVCPFVMTLLSSVLPLPVAGTVLNYTNGAEGTEVYLVIHGYGDNQCIHVLGAYDSHDDALEAVCQNILYITPPKHIRKICVHTPGFLLE